MSQTIYTIGHSTRSEQEFLDLLMAHRIQLLVDVRTIPKSRFNPQFNSKALDESLRRGNVEYLHMPELGGLRKPLPLSVNGGWRNAAFKGYADYMQTREFHNGLKKLLDMARTKSCAAMCAEAVHWRCHRNLLSDALLVHGVKVLHIQTKDRAVPHKLTPFAKVTGTVITYPPDQMRLE